LATVLADKTNTALRSVNISLRLAETDQTFLTMTVRESVSGTIQKAPLATD
jgi:hypothetical protein